MFPSREKEIKRNTDTVKFISAVKVKSYCRDSTEEAKIPSPVACLSVLPCNSIPCILHMKDVLDLLKN